MGSAKGQKHGGTGLILREDQQEFQNGVRREEIRRQKEDRALEKVMKAQQEGKGGFGGAVGGGWNDPDVSRHQNEVERGLDQAKSTDSYLRWSCFLNHTRSGCLNF